MVRGSKKKREQQLEIILFPKFQDWFWGPSNPVLKRYQYSFSGVKRPGCDVDHSFHLALRLKKSGAIPVFSIYAHNVEGDNFYLYFHIREILVSESFVFSSASAENFHDILN